METLKLFPLELTGLETCATASRAKAVQQSYPPSTYQTFGGLTLMEKSPMAILFWILLDFQFPTARMYVD